MINNLKFAIEFSNGQKRSSEATFSMGSTMITGKNGRGKSLNLELYAFSLFGAQALRGKAEDYKRILVEVKTTIKGKLYIIKRTKSNAEIFDADNNPLAIGTKPVNEFIVTLLGYGYDVFRIAHWCAQGDIQALANMKPTERKQMVDDVAGLTQMDSLITFIGHEIKIFKASIDSAESVLVKPIKPQAPETEPLKKIKSSLEALLEERQHYLNEKYQIDNLPVLHEPISPTKPNLLSKPEEPKKVKTELKELLTVEIPSELVGLDHRQVVVDLKSKLMELKPSFVRYEYINHQLKQFKLDPNDIKYRDLTLESLEYQHQYYQQALNKKQLLDQGSVTCPSCNTRHPIAQEALERFAEIDVGVLASPPLPLIEFKAYQEYKNLLAELESLNPLVSTYKTVEMLLNKFEPVSLKLIANEETERYNASLMKRDQDYNNSIYQAWLKSVADIENQNQNIEDQYLLYCNQYQLALSQYRQSLDLQSKQYDSWNKYGQDFLADCNVAILAKENDLKLWSTYDTLMAMYKSQMETYIVQKELILKEKEKLDDRKRAAKALVEIKSKVKSYIVPSLNKVASYLLNEMTGGEHCIVEVDQNFEVLVDNQPLRTLSGSGKDITNLAIRIALGRILTHRVLPVMLLDEIDSAMDDDRSAYTWNCIQKITPNIGQVLQVSHKSLPSQHIIVVS